MTVGPESSAPARPRVVLGVCGGIAAYKVVEVLRGLTESGHDVTVLVTDSALRFVGEPTWAALSGHPVATDIWSEPDAVAHVRLGQRADLVLVAPATADLLARAAHGRADDLLTATLLTARCPVLFAPAMHTEMWQHPATVANVATLRARGGVVIDPAVGRLTGSDSGPGRLPEPAELVRLARAVLARGALPADLAGRRVIVSAGGTREHLDPVRFLGNRSSGRQGYALARAAVARGAEVTVVAANVGLADPAGAKVIQVVSAEQLRRVVLDVARAADAVVMAAAVADFRPTVYSDSKIKKSGAGPAPIVVERTADVLAQLAALPPTERARVVVGFAAETGDATADVLTHAAAKLAVKGADLLVVNEVGPAGHSSGFEGEDNAAVLLGADGRRHAVGSTTKDLLAHAVWDAISTRW